MPRYGEHPDFPGYRVGSDGSVWSRWRRRGLGPGRGTTFVLGKVWRRMKLRQDSDGYNTVKLKKAKRKHFYRVSCLVLLFFDGPCPQKHQCRHLDGNNRNDSIRNLKWGTSTMNQEDRRRHGTLPMGEAIAISKLKVAAVRAIVSKDNLHISNAEFARIFGVTTPCVYAVRKGITWRHVTGFKRKA